MRAATSLTNEIFEKLIQNIDSGCYSVNLPKTYINNEQLTRLCQTLKTNTNVKNVDLSDNELDDDAKIIAEMLAINTGIRQVWLNINNVGSAGGEALARMLEQNVSIEIFSLAINQIGDTGAEAMARALSVNDSLVRLDVSYNRITNAGAKAFANALRENHSLQDLRLNTNSICAPGGYEISEALKVNKGLRRLDLHNNRIASGMSHHSNYKEGFKNNALSLVWLSTSDATPAFARALAVNNTLEDLNLSNTQMNDTGAKALASALKENKKLKALDISSNQIGHRGTIALAAMLRVNKFLINLNLRVNSQIGVDGFTALDLALEINSSLQVLDLGYTQLIRRRRRLDNYVGAIPLANALKKNKGLKKLVLSNNNVAITGLTVLADALMVNQSLTELDLAGNEIGDAGVKVMASVLTVNRCLQVLDLSGPIEVFSFDCGTRGMNDSSAIALIYALKENNSLRALRLTNNKFTDAIIPVVSAMLRENSTLKKLDLSSNALSDGGIQQFLALFERAQSFPANNTLQELYCDDRDCSDGATLKYLETV